MKILYRLLPGLLFYLALSACAPLHTRQATDRSDPPVVTVQTGTTGSDPVKTAPPPEKAVSPDADFPRKQEITDQQRIDEALSFYQESQQDWDQGLLDDAIDALDQSYDSILRILPDHNPDILQQKEDLRLLISKRIQEIYASRVRAHHVGKGGAIPLVMNTYVKQEIRRFQTKERRYFLDAYRRSGRYHDYIAQELEKAGLPSELAWLPLIESGYKEKALSRSRALGLWQFIASTGYRFNLKRDRWIDERMDFERSTQGAIAYLTALHDLFGDWTTALAAYNCGEGNVLRAIREQRVNYLDNFWDLYPMLPAETARYVPRFLATLYIVNNPVQFGFDKLETDPPLHFDKVRVNKEMKLGDIAKYLKIPRRVLENLNPALRQKVTPNYVFTLRVPRGSGELLLANLEQIPACRLTFQTYTRHRVRRGETLSQIADRYHTSVRTIARLNHIRDISRIRIGQKLRVPLRHPRAVFSSRKKRIHRAATHLNRYRVKRGDTLWSIARQHKTTISTIKRMNGLSSDDLRTGQILKVPAET